MAAALLNRAAPIAVLLALGSLAGCGVSQSPSSTSSTSAPEAGATAYATADAPLSIVAVPLALARPAAQPNVVADPTRRRFVLSWQERDAEGCVLLRTATLGADGALGELRDVARGCDWFVNWADFPSVAIADNGDWWTYVLQKSGASTYAYGIRLMRSEDDGRTWSAPITPHDDRTPTEHGFVSMVPMGGDRMLLAWLDGRNTLASVSDEGHDAHAVGHDDSSAGHAHAEGPMSLRSAEVGSDFVLRDEQEVDARVCSCCPTDLVRRGEGAVLVYRDRSEDEIRDVYAAEYRDGRWSEGKAVRTDGWRIAACPVNGPALAASGDRVAALWPTMAGATLSVKAAAVGESDAATVIESGGAVLGRPDLVPWVDGRWLASWLGAGPDGATALRIALLDADLTARATQDAAVLPPGRGTGMPKLASLGDVAVLVWTEPKGIEGSDARIGTVQVRQIRASLQASP
jgi:hypothetical protein